MWKVWLAVVTVVVFGLQTAAAQTPGEIAQQGILTDSLGNPISEGSFDLTFTIYDQEEGGTSLWTETQQVEVDEGLYTAMLGSQTPIDLPFDDPYWLGIQVDGSAELAPRLKFSAAPYARRAGRVDSVSTDELLDGSVTGEKLADAAVATSAISDGAVTASKIGTEAAQEGQILVANDTTGLGWSFLPPVSIVDRSIETAKISPAGGSTGQIMTVDGDSVAWQDPEEITGAALPDKSVRSVKLNSEDGGLGEVMLAAADDSVVWGQLGAAGLADGSVSTAKISVVGGATGEALINDTDSVTWGQIDTGGIADRSVTSSKVSASGGAEGQILTVVGDTVDWADPAMIGEASIDYDRISTAGGALGSVLTVATGDTTGWLPLLVGTPNLVNGAVSTPKLADASVTTAKVSPAGGELGQVMTRGADNSVVWADVDPGSFPVASVGLVSLDTTGAAEGDQMVFDGTMASWQTVPALPLPFSGSTDGNDPISFQILNPISFGAGNPVESYAIHGVMSSTTGGPVATAVRGENRAQGGFGIGVWGSHEGDGWGVYGSTPSGLAVYGSSLDGHAGYFDGRVTILGRLEKSAGSFVIDHPLDPENKTLSHSFVESPDMMNIYNGNVTLDADGTAVVVLPEWFDALNRDFRYQLTAIGAPGPNLYIAAPVANNQFTIAGGAAGMTVSWQVTGIRDDAYARANPIPVEEDKPADMRGRFLNPEAFGRERDASSAPQQEGLEDR